MPRNAAPDDILQKLKDAMDRAVQERELMVKNPVRHAINFITAQRDRTLSHTKKCKTCKPAKGKALEILAAVSDMHADVYGSSIKTNLENLILYWNDTNLLSPLVRRNVVSVMAMIAVDFAIYRARLAALAHDPKDDLEDLKSLAEKLAPIADLVDAATAPKN